MQDAELERGWVPAYLIFVILCSRVPGEVPSHTDDRSCRFARESPIVIEHLFGDAGEIRGTIGAIVPPRRPPRVLGVMISRWPIPLS